MGQHDPNPFDGLLTARDIACELGVTKPYVSHLLARGAMPVLRHAGRVFVRRDDFDAYARTRKTRSKPIRGLSPLTVQTLQLLAEWREATVSELAIGLGRHPGNVRKYIILLRHAELVEEASEPGSWTPTAKGDAFLADPATLAALNDQTTRTHLADQELAASA